MDYKKAYEKMVQRARELHKGGNALTKQQMEIVCPELAESEDKRVNEEIRNFLIDMECKREWIAYLEKQKDFNDMAFHEGYTLGFEDGMKSVEQKEQKPAEWSLPKDFEEAVYKVANFISPFDSQDELRRVSHRFAEQLMSLAKKELVEKPAEWSNTDMKEARDNLISVCRDWERGEQTALLPIVAARAIYFLEHLTEPKTAE